MEDIRILCQKLREKGIEGRSFWKPIHLQEPYKNAVKAQTLEVSSNLWGRILTLPCSTGITDKELEYVVATIKEFSPAVCKTK